jgi:starch synthase
LRVSLLTREFPPEVYGGAGVHVEHLAAALAPLVDVAVHCYGAPRASELVAAVYQPWDAIGDGVLGNLSVNLAMASGVAGTEVVHSHTWYANLGGHLAKLLHGVPHVMTSHSLEPRRPWKVDQLGGGYRVSAWCERTAIEAADAVIAVSSSMRDDVLDAYPAVDPARVAVVHNGIDTEVYQPALDPAAVLARLGIDPDRPFVVFVGRLTPQKGVLQLLDAAELIDPAAQLVLCAGLPDTQTFAAQAAARVEQVGQRRDVLWLAGMLERVDVIAVLTAATVFVCPSLYEPFGLVNLEAMACETAVVASAVGGIPEVVVDGETGFLVPVEVTAAGLPVDGARFAAALADRIDALLADPGLARRFGLAGRRRVAERFSWGAIAAQTASLYQQLLSRG